MRTLFYAAGAVVAVPLALSAWTRSRCGRGYERVGRADNPDKEAQQAAGMRPGSCYRPAPILTMPWNSGCVPRPLAAAVNAADGPVCSPPKKPEAGSSGVRAIGPEALPAGWTKLAGLGSYIIDPEP